MSGVAGSRVRRWLAAAVAVVASAATGAARLSAGEAVADVRVRLEMTDGRSTEGVLRTISGEAVGLEVDGGTRSLPVADVRQLVRIDPPSLPAGRVHVELADGTGLDGDECLWSGDLATVSGAGGSIRLPIARVRRVEFRPGTDPRPAGWPAWLAAVPESPAADLVVVAKDDAHEVVECAITAVSPESVTVVLDGETIPVRRAKVLGLVWSRPRAAPAGARVTIAGGDLMAVSVACAEGEVVLDGRTRLPVGLLRAIDFAAGRTVALCDLTPDRLATEPFVGELAGIEGVGAFFAPRSAPPPAGSTVRTMVVRPRTLASWPVPEGARRFHAIVTRAAEARPQASVRLAIRADDRPVHEAVIDAASAEGVPMDVDVVGANRLELLVDFVGDDPGCAVRLERPLFER